MTDRDPLDADFSQLKFVIGNLMDKARATPGLATLINLTTALIGVGIWYAFDGWIAFAGIVYAILSLLGIVKWVFGL